MWKYATSRLRERIDSRRLNHIFIANQQKNTGKVSRRLKIEPGMTHSYRLFSSHVSSILKPEQDGSRSSWTSLLISSEVQNRDTAVILTFLTILPPPIDLVMNKMKQIPKLLDLASVWFQSSKLQYCCVAVQSLFQHFVRFYHQQLIQRARKLMFQHFSRKC